MEPAGVTHVLFDFFGTLVSYVPGGPASPVRSAALVASFGGPRIDVAGFTEGFNATFAEYEQRATEDFREFAMDVTIAEYLRRVLYREPTPAEVTALNETYIDEWNQGVTTPSGVPAMVEALAGRYRLAVVSNTHEPFLVPGHLAAMGLTEHFDAVITSVELGWRKPHPAIYDEALQRLGIDAGQAVFVGDTYAADFVGPGRHGMYAYLIDPGDRHGVPAEQRLASIDELTARLR